MKKLIYTFLFVLCFVACSRPKENVAINIPADQYAQGFAITQHTDYTEAVVYDPWQQGKIMQRYYLVKDNNTPTPQNGTKICVPIKRIAITSSTHAGFLKALDKISTICGVCSPNLVYTDLSEADYVDLGDAMQLQAERVILTHPDAIMISTYAQGDVAREKLEKAGLPIIYNNEWTEKTPLARSEWIRLIGAFYDEQAKADSIFKQIENNYLELCDNIQTQLRENNIKQRSLMTGNNFRGTWYVPSGNTYVGAIYKDAGADYYYQNDSTNGSLPLGIETIVLNFKDADVWVGSNGQSMKELAEIDKTHTWFKAYQTNQVYNFYKRTTSQGGNDFWELGVVRPDLLLNDLVWVLYPSIMPNYEPVFTNHLE